MEILPVLPVAFTTAAPIDTTAIVLEAIQGFVSIAAVIALPLVVWWTARSTARREDAHKAEQIERDEKIAEALATANEERTAFETQRLDLQKAIADGVISVKVKQDSLIAQAKLIHDLTNSANDKLKVSNDSLQATNTMLEKSNSTLVERLSALETTLAAGFAQRAAVPPAVDQVKPKGTDADPIKVEIAAQAKPVEVTDVTPPKKR